MAHHQTAQLEFGLSDLADEFLQSYSSVFVLTDQHTAKNCLPYFSSRINSTYTVITVAPGEEHKNLKSVENICQRMLDAGADRKSVMVNLGGGVILDTGGFAASMYMRGIDFINIPTTLLAMVDASFGGKTGVDLNNYKNIIGFFSEPKLIIVEPKFLKTLTQRDLLNGFAEMIKHGLIANSTLLERTYGYASNPFLIDLNIIEENIRIKKKIVEEDFLEKGLRKVLNFGHTIGHAVESENIGQLLHGECVAIGMVAELFLSNKLAGLSDSDMQKHSELIRSIYSYVHCKLDVENVLKNISADKKNTAGITSMFLLKSPGHPSGIFSPTADEFTEAIRYTNTVFC